MSDISRESGNREWSAGGLMSAGCDCASRVRKHQPRSTAIAGGDREQCLSGTSRTTRDGIGQSVAITVQERNTVAMFTCCGKVRRRNSQGVPAGEC